jgi:hypothetical protein
LPQILQISQTGLTNVLGLVLFFFPLAVGTLKGVEVHRLKLTVDTFTLSFIKLWLASMSAWLDLSQSVIPENKNSKLVSMKALYFICSMNFSHSVTIPIDVGKPNLAYAALLTSGTDRIFSVFRDDFSIIYWRRYKKLPSFR